MTIEEIQKRLDAIAAGMVDAGLKAPEATHLHKSGGRHSVLIDCKAPSELPGGNEYESFHADTPEKCLSAADEYIAKLPDPDTTAKKNWHKKLGKVIDEGHDLALPDEVMQPLRAGSQAMSENLLTGPDQ